MLPSLSLTWKALNPDAQLWKIFFQQQHLPPWQALQASCLGSSAVASWFITWICYCGLSGCLVRAEANSFWFTFESKKLHFFAPFFLYYMDIFRCHPGFLLFQRENDVFLSDCLSPCPNSSLLLGNFCIKFTGNKLLHYSRTFLSKPNPLILIYYLTKVISITRFML